MPSTVVTIRVARPLADALKDAATSWGVTLSEYLRASALYMLTHPQVYGEEIAAARLIAIQSMDTPQQQAAARDYMASLAGFSLNDIVAEMGHDISDGDGYT